MAGVLPSLRLILLAILGSQALGGCGARTQLHSTFACFEEGEVRPCSRGCADGTMVCQEGHWSECELTPKSRTCENTCGAGIQHCEHEQWGTCYVEPVTMDCTNVCGIGTQSCVDDHLSECEVSQVDEVCSFGCGDGSRSCVDNVWSECDAPHPDVTVILAKIRDFSSSHPDMERGGLGGLEEGLVSDVLGDDDTPQYVAAPTGTESTSGPSSFYQWYHDSPYTLNSIVEIRLERTPGSDEFYQYVGRNFFPIDGELLGNETNPHNFHFTLEAHEHFIYKKGQQFNFEGDDDMWVFINKRLVIDLGGLHQALSRWVKLDKIADEIGLLEGGTYPLDIFFAERHTTASNFIVRTSITGLGHCPDLE